MSAASRAGIGSAFLIVLPALFFGFFFLPQGIAETAEAAWTARAGSGETFAEHASSRYELAFRARDALGQNFERDDVLWFDNAYSDAVPIENFTIRTAQNQSPRVRQNHARGR
jgi:hypothetical protein